MQTTTQFTVLFLFGIATAVGLGAGLAASADIRARPALRAFLPELPRVQLTAANASEPPLPELPAFVPQSAPPKPVLRAHPSGRDVAITRVAVQR